MFEGLRQGLIESYRPKAMPGTACLLCGARNQLMSLHVLEYYHNSSITSPFGLVPMSQSRGAIRGSVPICSSCAVPCSKCGLPITTPWHKKMSVLLQSHFPVVSIQAGQGKCRHAHPLLDLLSFLKPIRLSHAAPSEPNSATPEVLTMAALSKIERGESLPAFEFLKPGILELLKDTTCTRASITEDGRSPDELIYLLASNVANEMLCTGRYHVYRGVLSGSGHQLLAAFTKASEMLVECGFQTKEEHEKDIQSLRKEIKGIG